MSRISFSMMEAGYIPGDLGAFKKEAGKIKLYGDSAPAQPTDITQRSVTFPEQLQPYVEETLGKGKALTGQEYQPYTGQRQALFDPMQLQAQQNVANLAPSQQLGVATKMAGLAGLRAGDIGYDATQFGNQFTAPSQYQTGQFTTQNVTAPTLQQYSMGPSERVGTQSFTGAGTAASYMSPYTQNVTDIQTREAERLAGIERTKLGAQAVGAGAYGGGRQAIMEAEAARNLATQKGDITAKGLQDAYQQAMAQFNAEQGYGLTAQQANQQAGLTVGQQNLAAQLGIQQLGSTQQMQAALANQQANLAAQQAAEQSRQYGYGQQMTAAQQAAQYGLAGQQAGEQSKQFGANLGLQGIQAQLAAAGAMGQLGQTQFGQQKDIINAQAAAGAQRQAAQQEMLSTKYADFQRQQQYPYQQLSFMAELERGTPLSNFSQSIYQAPPSTAAQLAGAGLTYAGASKYFAGGGLTTLALHNMTK